MNRPEPTHMTDKEFLVLVFSILTMVSVLVLLTGCSSSKGQDGAPGPAGAPGTSPKLTFKPSASTQCPYGGTSVYLNDTLADSICNGKDGSPGQSIVGPRGDKGDPGVNLSPITIVQFCPGQTIYPSVFQEVGFCIAGSIYGTYSANDGFTALLPPGSYYSNAIGSSCDFNIGANCAISY